MNHELNPGDRFMLEFEVKETTRSKEALRATTGDGKEYFFYAGTLQHAKPMRPAVPEPRIPEIKVGQKWVTRGGSKNREKARVKVAKAYAKVTDQRKDFLHKLSSFIVHENQVICIEDLAVKNMVKNRHLSKSISDSGWGEFKRQLEYKSVWHGRTLVKVGRFFPSSKTCSTCGCIKDHLDLSERNWTCQYCGTEHDRDVNAALNVLAEGTSVIARGEESSGSLVVGPVSETVLCEAGIPVL